MRLKTPPQLLIFLLIAMLLAACGGGQTATQSPEDSESAEQSGEEAGTSSEDGDAEESSAAADIALESNIEADEFTGGEDLSGTTVTIFGAFVEDEAARFESAMVPFEEATGIDVVYEGNSDFETLITTRVEGGDPPDIAGFPQPGLMKRFADEAIDVTTLMDMEYLQTQYDQSWLDMASNEDGKMVGIWYRVTLKSLVWYPPKAFEEAGYEIPQTWDELIALSDQMVADGHKPWYAPMESGAATGWVGTDWIEDIMLRTTSLENYDMWVRGELPFSSPEVKNAFEHMGTIMLNDDYMYGGLTSILSNSFFDSGEPLLEDPPKAWMVRQGSPMPGWLEPVPEVGPEGELYYFYFPPIDETYGRPALVAGDVYSVFNDRPEVRAVAKYMTTARSMEAWIKQGGILSPHTDVVMDWYPPVDRGIAEILAEADAFRFDGSDLMPGAVGAGTFWSGVVDYLSGEDLDSVLQTIDESWPEE
jgi:alpha-glucoside transport system substrate-binding protein